MLRKYQVAIMLDFENIELLRQVQTAYHLKTMGNSVELIIRQWQLFLEDRKKAAEAQRESSKEKKAINPFTNP